MTKSTWPIAAMAGIDAAFAHFGGQGFGRALQEQNSRSQGEKTLIKNICETG